MRGTGKTTLWRKKIRDWPARWVFVFDASGRQFARGEGMKFAATIEQLNYSLATQKFIIFDPSQMFPGDRHQAFEFFCRWVMTQAKTMPRGTKLFAVDELQGVQRTGTGGMPQAFAEMVDEGRWHEIDMIAVAQRLNQVNDAVRAQVSKLITFRHQDPRALQMLEESGFNPEEVKRLPPVGKFLEREDNAKSPDDTRETDSNAPVRRTKTDRYRGVARDKPAHREVSSGKRPPSFVRSHNR